MRLSLWLVPLLSTIGLAQTDDHAHLLLRDVITTAQATRSWRAEGVVISEMTGPDMNLRDETRFKIAAQSPLRMRQENSGSDTTLSVCDGTDMFYFTGGTSFYRSPAAVSQGCSLSLADFYKLEENPVSVTIIGRDRVQLTEGGRECEVVRAEWNRDVQVGRGQWHLVRTMCIDPVRHLIVRDIADGVQSVSGMHSMSSTNYTSLELNPNLPSSVFEFSIETGAMEDQGPQMGNGEAGSKDGVYSIGPRVSYPRLVSKVEPAYPEEARGYRASGLVLISCTVGSDGTPRNLKVVRGLGHGLDEKAIKAAGRWRFDPGMKDGVAVAVGPVTFAVTFRPQ